MTSLKALYQKCKKAVVGGIAGLGAVVVASSAHATDIIDYAATATALETALGTAITAAVGVGVAMLTAKLGWMFFRKFARG